MARTNVAVAIDLEMQPSETAPAKDDRPGVGYSVKHHRNRSVISYRAATGEAEIVTIIDEDDHVNIANCLVLDLLVLTEG